MKKLIFSIATVSLLAGCTDASFQKLASYGDSARVTCYSGGKLIFDDFSTGKVASEANSDGYYFKSSTTNRGLEMSGDCRIDYGAVKPDDWKPIGVG